MSIKKTSDISEDEIAALVYKFTKLKSDRDALLAALEAAKTELLRFHNNPSAHLIGVQWEVLRQINEAILKAQSEL